MADLGLHITLLPIIGQALPRSAATCQNQLLVLQIGLCLFLYVFPVFEHLSVLFCSVLLFLGRKPLRGLPFTSKSKVDLEVRIKGGKCA